MVPKPNAQEFSCDICEAVEAIEVPHAREYTGGQPIHICTRCGFVYVRERRSASAIADTWSKEIFGSGYTAAIPAVQARLTYVAEFIQATLGLAQKRVCDIGAGEGMFLDKVRQPAYGASVFGIEPSQANCERMRKFGIACFQGTIEDFERSTAHASERFDIVTITWTMENCQSPRAMLASAHRILKPGGHVVIATGSRILVPFKKPLHCYLVSRPADSHAFRWSAQTLQAQLAVAHFSVRHVNQYIDSDILCMIAERRDPSEMIPWRGDDAQDVRHFFERWHAETRDYFPTRVPDATVHVPVRV